MHGLPRSSDPLNKQTRWTKEKKAANRANNRKSSTVTSVERSIIFLRLTTRRELENRAKSKNETKSTWPKNLFKFLLVSERIVVLRKKIIWEFEWSFWLKKCQKAESNFFVQAPSPCRRFVVTITTRMDFFLSCPDHGDCYIIQRIKKGNEKKRYQINYNVYQCRGKSGWARRCCGYTYSFLATRMTINNAYYS